MSRISLAAGFLAVAGFASAASACDGCKKSAPAARPAVPSNGVGAFGVSTPVARTPAFGRAHFHDAGSCVDGQCVDHGHQGHDPAECADGRCDDAADCSEEGCGHAHAAPPSRYRFDSAGQFRRPSAVGGTRPSSLGAPAGPRFRDGMPSEVAPRPGFDGSRVPSPFYGPATVASVCPVDGRSIETAESPVRVSVSGRSIWLCCEGCEGELRRDPARYLGRSRTPLGPQPAAPSDAAAILEQGTCPVTGEPLDPSAEVWKVWVAGRPIFVCCRDCVGRLTEMARREQGTMPR